MLIAESILAVVGPVFIVMGYVIWKKEKISLFHDYHHNNVSQEDKADFCRISGNGIISIGAGILASGLIMGFTQSALSFIAFAAGFIIGIVLLIFAGKKYNTDK